MKPIFTKLLLIACMVFSSSTVLAQSKINCDVLHGNWSGEHTDSAGNYSRWTASYAADGSLGLTFFDSNGTKASTQQGLWECKEGTLSTTMGSGLEKLEFDYKILSLDQGNISYKSLLDGTVFNSRRLEE